MSNNATCFMTVAPQEPPLVQHGVVVIQAHHIGWMITGLFALTSTTISFWLVNKHLQWYTNKREQRYIVRILFMVPIYSIVSFASYLFWNHSTPLLLLRDCYESTVLTSFFYLLLNYVSPNADQQRAVFIKVGLSKENDHEAIKRGEPVKKWLFPLGFVASKPEDGLYFLQIMKWGILQYCVIRPLTTLAAVILNYLGLYCEDSWSPGWGYVYITVVVSISVSIAMYCLIQLYIPISGNLAPHKPLLKLFSIKAVVFLTFWQATFLSILSFFNVVKATEYMTADDINVGIGAILETAEMTIFALIHIKAFSYKPYCPLFCRPEDLGYDLHETPQRTPRLRALGHAFDFRETLRELWAGCVYILRRWRGIETDGVARRLVVRTELFGVTVPATRPRQGPVLQSEEDRLLLHKHLHKDPSKFPGISEKPGFTIAVNVEEEFHVNAERQWIGTGDDYIYGLKFSRRERSAGLAEQIGDELERRGMSANELRSTLQASEGVRDRLVDSESKKHEGRSRRQGSWWRGVYDRLSRTSWDDGHDSRDTPRTAPTTSRQHKAEDQHREFLVAEEDIKGGYSHLAAEEDLYDSIPSSLARERHKYRPISPANEVPSGAGHPHLAPVGGIQTSPQSGSQFSSGPSSAGEPSMVPTGSIRAAPDIVLSWLFPDFGPSLPTVLGSPITVSEASSRSSQTHPSSHGHHVRLTTPALAIPTSQWRATVRTPVVVDAGHSIPSAFILSTEESQAPGTEGRAVHETRDRRGRSDAPQSGRSSDRSVGPVDPSGSGEESPRSRGRHRRERARHDSFSASPPPTASEEYRSLSHPPLTKPVPSSSRHRHPSQTTTKHTESRTTRLNAFDPPSTAGSISLDSLAVLEDDVHVHKREPHSDRWEAEHSTRRFSSPPNLYAPVSDRDFTGSSMAPPSRPRPQAHKEMYAPRTPRFPPVNSAANTTPISTSTRIQLPMAQAHSTGSGSRLLRPRAHVHPPPRASFLRHSLQGQAIREERESSGSFSKSNKP
ncbi:hypothetical protein M0805_000699 [Coniferiporia weirii]|nr:hypothetical protein M0805_000699 [Coniferiporia weirii]